MGKKKIILTTVTVCSLSIKGFGNIIDTSLYIPDNGNLSSLEFISPPLVVNVGSIRPS